MTYLDLWGNLSLHRSIKIVCLNKFKLPAEEFNIRLVIFWGGEKKDLGFLQCEYL